MKAIWKDTVIAESEDTVVIEGNHYFPLDAVRALFLRESETHTRCPWKGLANYFHVVVGGTVNEDAAWYYPDPKAAARGICGRIAFWRGVEVKK